MILKMTQDMVLSHIQETVFVRETSKSVTTRKRIPFQQATIRMISSKLSMTNETLRN